MITEVSIRRFACGKPEEKRVRSMRRYEYIPRHLSGIPRPPGQFLRSLPKPASVRVER